MRALIVEDEPDVARLVAFHVRGAGFDVETAATGADALAAAAAQPPDVVVLDVRLPDIDGYEVCRRLRATEATRRAGVLMLTAHASPDERIAGLEAGVDDFVAKPFAIRELVLRITAVARRTRTAERALTILRLGEVALDRDALIVTVADRPVALRPLELRVLELFLASPGTLWSREQILERVWGAHAPDNIRLVDVTICRVRDALGAEGALIETVLGAGYRARVTRP